MCSPAQRNHYEIKGKYNTFSQLCFEMTLNNIVKRANRTKNLQTPFVFADIPIILTLIQKDARVAQWIEQKFPKLLVGGSIPLSGTIFKQKKH